MDDSRTPQITFTVTIQNCFLRYKPSRSVVSKTHHSFLPPLAKMLKVLAGAGNMSHLTQVL